MESSRKTPGWFSWKSYDAFGNITEQTGNVNNNVTYAGYQYDKETGLYYLMSRMYDPTIARFLQEDTYRGNKNDPLSLNLYTYCCNNPIIYVDPNGHIAVTIKINDKTISGSNTTGKTVVSAREVAEAFNWKIDLDSENSATISANGKKYTYNTTGTSCVKVNLRDFVEYFDSNKNITYKENKNGTATVNITSFKDPLQLGNNAIASITSKGSQPVAPVRINGNDEVVVNNSTSQNQLKPVYYAMNNPDWSENKYSILGEPEWKTANDGKPQNIGLTGCGSTSASMVVSTLTGTEVKPDVMSTYAVEKGYRTKYDGTSTGLFYGIADKYQLNVIHTDSVADVNKSLQNGNAIVVTSVGKGHFTGGNHYIVLTSIDTNNTSYTVFDPNLDNKRYSKYSDGAITVIQPGIVKVNIETVSSETNGHGYFIFTK